MVEHIAARNSQKPCLEPSVPQMIGHIATRHITGHSLRHLVARLDAEAVVVVVEVKLIVIVFAPQIGRIERNGGSQTFVVGPYAEFHHIARLKVCLGAHAVRQFLCVQAAACHAGSGLKRKVGIGATDVSSVVVYLAVPLVKHAVETGAQHLGTCLRNCRAACQHHHH